MIVVLFKKVLNETTLFTMSNLKSLSCVLPASLQSEEKKENTLEQESIPSPLSLLGELKVTPLRLDFVTDVIAKENATCDSDSNVIPVLGQDGMCLLSPYSSYRINPTNVSHLLVAFAESIRRNNNVTVEFDNPYSFTMTSYPDPTSFLHRAIVSVFCDGNDDKICEFHYLGGSRADFAALTQYFEQWMSSATFSFTKYTSIITATSSTFTTTTGATSSITMEPVLDVEDYVLAKLKE